MVDGTVFFCLFLDLKNIQLNPVSYPFYIVTGILIALGVLIYLAQIPEVKAACEDETDEIASSSSYANGK